MFLCPCCKKFKITCNCNKTNCKCERPNCECAIIIVDNLHLFFLRSQQFHKIDNIIYQIVEVLSEKIEKKFIIVERGRSLFPPLNDEKLKQRLYDLAKKEWQIGEHVMSPNGIRWIISHQFQLQKDGYKQINKQEMKLLMSLEDYKVKVKSSGLIDFDGHAKPVINDKINRNVILKPSDGFDRINDKVDHVVWYNK